MTEDMRSLAARLATLGMPMRDDILARAHALLERRGRSHHALDDLWLMTICVEAYRRPDSDVPVWV